MSIGLAEEGGRSYRRRLEVEGKTDVEHFCECECLL
jgi:hypothetical protein